MVRNLTPDDIRTILLRDWDPLAVGNNPKLSDEYDSCSPVIYRMIQAGTTVQEIQRYLIAVDEKGGGSPNVGGAKLAATRLMGDD